MTNHNPPTAQKPEVIDLLGGLIDYEMGLLDDDSAIDLFQRLIDTGLVWRLQGHYGRTAARLIEAGHCRPAA